MSGFYSLEGLRQSREERDGLVEGASCSRRCPPTHRWTSRTLWSMCGRARSGSPYRKWRAAAPVVSEPAAIDGPVQATQEPQACRPAKDKPQPQMRLL